MIESLSGNFWDSNLGLRSNWITVIPEDIDHWAKKVVEVVNQTAMASNELVECRGKLSKVKAD